MPNENQTVDQIREQARRQLPDLTGFDFNAPAELFPSRSKKGRDRFTYQRFDTAAEALRFAVEEMSAPALLGVYLESEETRWGAQEIRRLYGSIAYPLKRRTVVPEASCESTSIKKPATTGCA
jgi:hypothetical protein